MQYSVGTISVTNGSATVTGSGTAFLANVSAGNAFTVVSSGIVYDVASVASDTSLTLSAPYQGATGSGLSYTIHTGFTSPDQFPLLKQGDIETATIISRAINKIQQRFNLVGDASAILAAGIYPNIAAGLSATVDGDYFFVVSGSEFILYLNSSGSEVEQLKFASLSIVQQLATELSTAVDSAETFADNAGTSATNAAASASAASASASAASTSASNAASSATAAASSASSASTSATNAATSESNALSHASSSSYSADIAMSNANFKGRWSDLTGSLVVPSSVSHDGSFWQLLENIADVTADEPGVTANWQEIVIPDSYIVYDGSGNATFTGNVTAPQVNADNIRIDGNTISSTNTNGNITIDPNGTGTVEIPANTNVTGAISATGDISILSASTATLTQTSASTFGAFSNYKNNLSDLYLGVNNSAGTLVGGVGGAYGSFIASYGAYPFDIATDGTTRIRTHANGNVHIGGTTDPGVKLGVTGAITATTGVTVATSQDAITAWKNRTAYTPEITGSGGSAGSFAAEVIAGEYVRIGNVIIASVRIFNITDKGSWTGALRIGLPYLSAAPYLYVGPIGFTSFHTFDGQLCPYAVSSTSYGAIAIVKSGAQALNMDWSDLVTTSGNRLEATFIYSAA